jgi:hypothetical protein
MNKSMWNNEAVKAYESGQGVVLVEKPYPHYEPIPQHTWVGLTDEDRFELAKAQYGWEDLLFAAEAKLKEKNT